VQHKKSTFTAPVKVRRAPCPTFAIFKNKDYVHVHVLYSFQCLHLGGETGGGNGGGVCGGWRLEKSEGARLLSLLHDCFKERVHYGDGKKDPRATTDAPK